MLLEYMEHLTNYFKHVDAILFLNSKDVIEYSAYFSREKNEFIVDDFIGKNIYEVYPSLTPETCINRRVRESGEPVLEMPITNCDYKNRIFHFISSTFPLYINNQIIGTVEFSIYDDSKYIDENKRSSSSLYQLNDFITQNAVLMQMKENVAKIACTDSSVLIYGETGTGKELIAQALCSHSARARKPFVAVNCSAIPPTLIESTLFGTVKGSFTGAVDRKGLFENAEGGTLFLDELNSLDIHLQSKLLRTIENREIYKAGGTKAIPINVRLIAAMNEPPTQAIAQNRLRADLYYRLSVTQVNIPPLRERRDDIPLLIQAFMDQFNRKMGKNICCVDYRAMQKLQEYSWPGNVRELKNFIEHAFLICEGTTIHLEDLPTLKDALPQSVAISNLGTAVPIFHSRGSLNDRLAAFEKTEIENALKLSRNLMEVADHLGISRQTLQYKMKKYGLK